MSARTFLLVLLLAAIPAVAEIQISSIDSLQPDIAWNGSKFAVVYWNEDSLEPLVLVTIDKAGANPGPEIVAMGISAPRNPVIVAGPGVWAAAWRHLENDGNKIYFAAFDDAGTFTIPPVQISGTVGNPNFGAALPSMVFTGSRYYVTWYYRVMTPNGLSMEVDIAGIDADGTISIPWQTAVPDRAYFPWIAWNADTSKLGIAWGTTTQPATTLYRGSTLSSWGLPTGTVEDISPPPSSNRDGRLGAYPGGFAFGCFTDLTSGPLGQGDLYFTPLDADMDATSAPVPLTQGEDNQRTGNIIWTGAGFIWPVEHFEPSGYLYEYLFRFDETGSLIAQPSRLSNQPEFWVGSQWGPRAAFADNQVLGVTWQRGPASSPYIYFEAVPTIEVMVGEGPCTLCATRVKSRNPLRGVEVLSFLAYPGGRYGVNVAAGKVDPEPLDKLLTGPGPAPLRGPEVRGFTGGAKPIPGLSFYSYGTLRTGVHVATADLDADGMEEIVTGSGPRYSFGPHVRGFNYDGGKASAIPAVNFFAYPSYKYGVEPAGGDVEGDGFAEIVTGPGPAPFYEPNLRIFDYDGSAIALKTETRPFLGWYGLLVGTGDFDASGLAEVTASLGPGPLQPSDVKVHRYQGGLNLLTKFTPFPTLQGGAHQGSGDVELDSDEVLCVTPGFLPTNSGALKVYRLGRLGFSSLPKFDQTVFGSYGATCTIGNMGM